ncbi:MAG: hypothetical protein RMJ07_01585 [Nitrososphaerota archaeon]|nr:hypothetical protein [Candidatus Bathyarchaeota archaeon]MDW8048361.1 hypothetical protein [Nitrososphaerota archaeon]
MSTEEGGKSSYLDLLISTLMQHEKSLDALVERLERIYESIAPAYRGEPRMAGEGGVEIVYIKVKTSRPIEDVERIIKSLKEEPEKVKAEDRIVDEDDPEI